MIEKKNVLPSVEPTLESLRGETLLGLHGAKTEFQICLSLIKRTKRMNSLLFTFNQFILDHRVN